jgi:hypothetical protein
MLIHALVAELETRVLLASFILFRVADVINKYGENQGRCERHDRQEEE